MSVVEKANERRSYGSDKLDVVKRTNSSLKSDGDYSAIVREVGSLRENGLEIFNEILIGYNNLEREEHEVSDHIKKERERHGNFSLGHSSATGKKEEIVRKLKANYERRDKSAETILCEEMKKASSKRHSELDQKVVNCLWTSVIEVFYETPKDKYDWKNFCSNVLSKSGEEELKQRLKKCNARVMTSTQLASVETTNAMKEKMKEIFQEAFSAFEGLFVAFEVQEENYKLGQTLKDLEEQLLNHSSSLRDASESLKVNQKYLEEIKHNIKHRGTYLVLVVQWLLLLGIDKRQDIPSHLRNELANHAVGGRFKVEEADEPEMERQEEPVHEKPVHEEPVHEEPHYEEPHYEEPRHAEPRHVESYLEKEEEVYEPNIKEEREKEATRLKQTNFQKYDANDVMPEKEVVNKNCRCGLGFF